MKTTLKKVAQILAPGTLEQKHSQICDFLAGEATMLYSGEVDWKLTLPSSDKVLNGNAENMDAAFVQIRRHLEDMLKNTPPAAKISLAVKEKQPE